MKIRTLRTIQSNQRFSFYRLALVCAVSATIQLPALAAYPFVTYGLRYYKAQDYSSAAGYFKKAVEATPGDPKAHYLYGLAQMQLGKMNDALNSFYQSYQLDPSTSYAPEIRKIWAKYRRTPIGKAPAAAGSQATISPHTSTSSQTQAQAPAGDDEPEVKPEELEAVKRRLPKINSYSQSGPSLNQFNQWSSMQQGSYLFGNARPALAEAENNSQAAQQQLEQAKKQLEVALPVFPNYGETTDDFKKRRARIEKASKVLLEPYQELATDCRNKLQEATTIKNRAEQELNRGTMITPFYPGGTIYVPAQ